MGELTVALLFVIVLLIAHDVLTSAQSRQTLLRMLDHAERADTRKQKQTADLLDRLMARDFSEYKVSALGEGQEGGWEPPSSSFEESEQVIPGRGLLGGTLRVMVPDEDELTGEDEL